MLGPTFNTLNIMNRTYLINAIDSIATADGYSFYTDGEERMSEQIKSYPAAWLQPPKFQQMEGRKHGKVTYDVTLHVMEAGAKLSPVERQQTWSRLENELIEIFSKLSDATLVIAVEDLKIRHTSSTLTTHGEVAATATAEVVTFF